MAIYEMGPWATAVEDAMVQTLGGELGFEPGSFAGLLTSGGSLANLTALLTARNVALPDGWQNGVGKDDHSPVMIGHAESHYSALRAAGILGLGTDQFLPAALNDGGRIDPKQLDNQLAQLRAKAKPIVAVIACACSTRLGVFDPLEDIADVCERHGVWLHVDAAHGGAVCLSEKHKHLLKGIHRADSVVWDAHKMLFMPALCAFVFYRDKAHRLKAFDQDAPYLFDPVAPELAEFDSGLQTIECTKRALAFGLWGAWSVFGKQLFSDLVDVTFDRAQDLFKLLVIAEDFEPIQSPEANIVVFRYLPDDVRNWPASEVGIFQWRLRRRLIESGQYYIVPGQDKGTGALRAVVMNPLTNVVHFEGLLAAIRIHGQAILQEVK
jgi:L-2,4-diaminobutyrate decarboxylase